jgi:hypothetical protein
VPRAEPINALMSVRLNREAAAGGTLDSAGNGLQPEDKAAILDAQAQHLRGTIHRVEGRAAEAEPALRDALARLIAVRAAESPR